MARCVVDGYGFMGSMHAGVLHDMGHEIACVSHRQDVGYPVYGSVRQALSEFNPDFYIISSETCRHVPTLKELAAMDFRGKVLVEKPLGMNSGELGEKPRFPVFVAYNMRFLPVIQRVIAILGDERLLYARFSVGGHLSGWRPGQDYRRSYSARKARGGGVLRDLSHEIDLALLFCGKPRKVTACAGNWAGLDMDCESCADICMEMDKCICHIHLDCLDRNPHRIISIHTNSRSIYANIQSGQICTNGIIENTDSDYGHSYRYQLDNFINQNGSNLCTWKEGCMVLNTIKNIEENNIYTRNL